MRTSSGVVKLGALCLILIANDALSWAQEIASAPQVGELLQFPNSQVDPNLYVRVRVNAVPGPMGYVVVPTTSAATQVSGADAEATQAIKNYTFPSIVVYISSAPVVYTPDSTNQNEADRQSGLRTVVSAQESNRYPKWLDATVTIFPKDSKGNPLSSACTDGSIQVLGLLPQQTLGGTKNNSITSAANTLSDTAGAIATLYPNGETVGTATKALSVMFNDILPPHPIAYQYAYMDGNCTFGWYFRPNTSSTAGSAGASSIIGLQTGIVMLKVKKSVNVASLGMSASTLSLWNKRPSKYNKTLFTSVDTPSDVKLFSAPNIDYSQISDLTGFPALIAKADAEKIVHIGTDTDWQKFVASQGIVTTPDGAWVTSASITQFLTAKGTPVKGVSGEDSSGGVP